MMYAQESYHHWQTHIHNLTQFFEVLDREYEESKVLRMTSEDDLYDPLEAGYSHSPTTSSHDTNLFDD